MAHKNYSDYLHMATDTENLRETVNLTVKAIRKAMRKLHFDFDTVAFTGMSGALIAPMVAVRLKKQMLLVRKPRVLKEAGNEIYLKPTHSTHSSYRVEGNIATRKFIIIDDFIQSGDTVNYIRTTVTEAHANFWKSGSDKLSKTQFPDGQYVAPVLEAVFCYNGYPGDDLQRYQEERDGYLVFNLKKP